MSEPTPGPAAGSESRNVAKPGPRQAGTSAPEPADAAQRSASRLFAAILGIIGILAIIAAILYISGAANSVSFMVGGIHHGHHLIRTGVAFVVGVILLTGARYISRTAGKPDK